MRIEKTVSKPKGVGPGDELMYTIRVTAKDTDVKVTVEDEARFAEPGTGGWVHFLDGCYPESRPCDCSPEGSFCSTDGYTIPSGSPMPDKAEWVFSETAGSQPRLVLKKKFIWEIDQLRAGETVEFRYIVRVHPDYDPKQNYSLLTCNSATASTRVGLHSDTAGPYIVCVNAEGAENLLNCALNISSCLTKGPPVDWYNRYDPACVVGISSEAADYLSGWGDAGVNDIDCVSYVVASMKCANLAVLAVPCAGTFENYVRGQYSGYQGIRNGQELPRPGDILIMGREGAYGHVGIVESVIPPGDGNEGKVTFIQANAGSIRSSLAISTDGTVDHWHDAEHPWTTLGFIRYLH